MLVFRIVTLGCKVNQYDGCAISSALRAEGLSPANDGNPADLTVINTCCVTSTAMRKSRQAIRRAVRRAPEAFVLVAGCYGDYDPQRIGQVLSELNVPRQNRLVVGHHDDLAKHIRLLIRKLRLSGVDRKTPSHLPGSSAGAGGDDIRMSAECITSRPTAGGSIRTRRMEAVKDNVSQETLGPIERFGAHQRAFVKVQDGCDAFCSYCIVPFTRCRVLSKDMDSVENECRRLVANGHREIVLCGVFLGAYGRTTAIRRRWDTAPSMLPALIERIGGIENLWRLRLSSLEPADVTDELLASAAGLPNFAPHLHLPLQSGSADILRRMNRQYTPDDFLRSVDRLRGAFDRPAVTTDIIVGFPGESEEDFRRTLDIARSVGFAKIHAFPFSPIRGTVAWRRRAEAPPSDVVKDRLSRLCAVEAETAAAFRRQFVGETMEALVESGAGPRGDRKAMTDRYMTVEFSHPETHAGDLTGQVVSVRVTAVTDEGLSGRRESVIA